jgi:hypothetical protein
VAPVALTGVNDVTTATSGSASSLACNKPSALSDGNLLVCAGYFRNSGATITAPSGWTQFGPLNTTNETFGLWSKPVASAAGEPASYTFSTSAGTGRLLLTIFRVTGADLVSPLDAQGALGVYTGTTSVVGPAVTATGSSALLLAYFINNTTVSTVSVFTAPGGMSEVNQLSIVSGASTSSHQICQQTLTTLGTTGTRTASISPAAANSGGFMVTVDPVAAPRGVRVAPQAVNRAATY